MQFQSFKTHLKKREIRKLTEMTDIVKLVKERDILDIKAKKKNHYCKCIFHDGDKNPSLCFIKEKNFFYCFGCGQAGDALDILINFYSGFYKPKQRALRELLTFNNISVKELRRLCKNEKEKNLSIGD